MEFTILIKLKFTLFSMSDMGEGESESECIEDDIDRGKEIFSSSGCGGVKA
jgi:hypothetical protein